MFFPLFSFSLAWLALYGGLPITTIIGLLFCFAIRSEVRTVKPKEIQLLARMFKSHIIERIHKADILELIELARLLLVRIFDVQIGDVIRQDRNFIAVQFMVILIFQLRGRQVLDQLGDERPCASGGVQISMQFSPSVLPKCLNVRWSALSIIKRRSHPACTRFPVCPPPSGYTPCKNFRTTPSKISASRDGH